MRTILLCCLLLVCLASNVFSQSPYIHVNQFGYWPNAVKVAVLSDPQAGYNSTDSYTPSAQLQVRDAVTDAVVYSTAPTVWNGGNTHAQSGDVGFWLDFSPLTTPGEYYLLDPGNNERSAVFRIQNGIYDDILKAAGRMFYYNRCGIAKAAPYAEVNWRDASSFAQDANTRYIYDPTNVALEKDMSGGWFDAGDYNKYVTFTVSVIHDLLWAYRENPTAFGDNWNIPESGNGIPDLLDEIKWELDWLLKMNNVDGSTHIKMGSRNYAENTSSPPSLNTDTRYYGPTCSAASIAVAGIFAHAATVFDAFPGLNSYRNLLENRAVSSWAYVLPLLGSGNLDEACDDGSIVSGDADWTATVQRDQAVTSAVHLWELTGNSLYNTYIMANAPNTEPLSTDFWGIANMALTDALLLYTILPGGSSSLKSNITSSFTTAVGNNWNDFFGFSNSDLYRSQMPDWSYHWGSNKSKAEYGVLNRLIVNYGIAPANNDSYTQKALEHIHYFCGVNPQGLVYLSNMYSLGGDRCVNEIYHGWFADGTDWDHALNSLYGPAPGYVSGGANKDFTQNFSPPANQPIQKSYLDFNDDWPRNSWEISEPAIYYQASFVRLLANFVDPNVIPLPVEVSSFEAVLLPSDKVQLNWTTASERNNDYFEIERSKDGQAFEFVKRVQGLGNSQQLQSYAAIDEQPLAGRSYYRLRQVDQNGADRYSQVRSIERGKGALQVNLGPNPATDELVLRLQSDRDIDLGIRLYAMDGRVLGEPMLQTVRAGVAQQFWIDLQQVSYTGTMIVQLYDGKGETLWVRKVIRGEK